MNGPHVYMLLIYRCPRFPLQLSLSSMAMADRVCIMNGNVLKVEDPQSEIAFQEQCSAVTVAEIAAFRGTSSVVGIDGLQHTLLFCATRAANKQMDTRIGRCLQCTNQTKRYLVLL